MFLILGFNILAWCWLFACISRVIRRFLTRSVDNNWIVFRRVSYEKLRNVHIDGMISDGYQFE